MNSLAVEQESLEPIVKTLIVNLAVEETFRLFTAEAGKWWPLKTHSVGGDLAVTCVLEGHVGGQFYEIDQDGSMSEWGRVLAWEPPQRVVFSFYPGRSPATATEVEVAFAAQGRGTQVTLTHRGWELCEPAEQARRGGYERGWDFVLSKYVEASS